jgi:hypothetical protein
MFEFAAFNLHKEPTNCWFLARKERIKYQFESIIANSVLNYALMHDIFNNLIAIIAFGIYKFGTQLDLCQGYSI